MIDEKSLKYKKIIDPNKLRIQRFNCILMHTDTMLITDERDNVCNIFFLYYLHKTLARIKLS